MTSGAGGHIYLLLAGHEAEERQSVSGAETQAVERHLREIEAANPASRRNPPN